MNDENYKILWWIKPYNLILGLILPVYVLIYIAGYSPDNAKNYFTSYYFLLGLTYILIFAATCYIFSKVKIIHSYRIKLRFSPGWLDFLAIATILAYLIWFWDIVHNPQLLLFVFDESVINLRQEISTIPGITTLVQAGVVYSVFYSIYRWRYRIKMHWRFRWYMYAIILLAAFRMLAWSERLGLVEVILPLALVYLPTLNVSKGWKRTVLVGAPYIGLMLLIIFFGISEFFRSWAAQAQYGSQSLPSYVLERFYLYYQTSLNNGSGLLTEFPWPELKGQYTFLWLYNFPAIGGALTSWTGISHACAHFLDMYGRIGFTTFSAIFPVFYDFGILGGFIYAAILGGCTGLFYRQFEKRSGPGIFLYPIMFIALTEMLRLLYLGTTRIFPIVAILTLGYFIIRTRAKQA